LRTQHNVRRRTDSGHASHACCGAGWHTARATIPHPLNQAITEILMSLLGWIVLGLIAGFIASKIINRTGEGVVVDILLGIVGAVVGGWLFNVFGMRGVSGLNLYSMLVSVIGACVVLVLYHALFRSGFRRL
jgi:uncharacterized membrane protein YeaQ/YmgE (transglycosylase-associated protein family)